MSKAKFVEDIRILIRQVGKQYSRLLYLLPDLFDDTPCMEQFIGPDRFKACVSNRRYINLLVIPIKPTSEGHHHEAGIKKLADSCRLAYLIYSFGLRDGFLRNRSLQWNDGRLGFYRGVELTKEIKVCPKYLSETLCAVTRNIKITCKGIEEILILWNLFPFVEVLNFLEFIYIPEGSNKRLLTLDWRTRRNNVLTYLLKRNRSIGTCSGDKSVLIG